MSRVIVSGTIVLSGLLTRHDAFDTMRNLPPLPDHDYHYVTADDCALIGATGVMVVAAEQYNIIVGDCAWQQDVPYRRRMNYASDIAQELWESEDWPPYPIPGTIYLFPQAESAPVISGPME